MLKLKGKKVLVVGLGKSGTAAVRYLCDQGAKVTAVDQKSKNELNEPLKALADLKFDLEAGKHDPKTFAASEMIVLSPGVPMNAEGLAEARAAGVPIINDIELAFAHMKAPIIAVTGTNGKTTTTTLITEMLKADGKKVFTGGNIGTPVLDLVLNNETPDAIVLELSSYQLESIDQFVPTVAVITNMEPNHLDRYPAGLESYYAAKRRIVKNATAETALIANLDNDPVARLAETFKGKTFYFTKRNPMNISNNLGASLSETFQGAYLQRPKAVFKTPKSEEIYDMILCKLPGDHNRENFLAAIAAVKQIGCSKEAIQKTIESFKGVSHRLEYVRKKDGVVFYNDSKSTNVSSTIRALSSFAAPTILIAGGRDKDQDFSPMIEFVKKKVKNLILVGEAKEKINRVIGDFSETLLVGTFEEAILLAYQKSRTGDIVLLSPSCASQDMFKNFEERGEYFKKLVAQL